MKKFVATLSSLLMALCVSFAFVGCIDDKESTKENNFKQYYTNDCPIVFFDGNIGQNNFTVNIVNNSDKTIDSYSAVYILYDIDGNSLICNNESKYNYIDKKDMVLRPHRSQSCMYIIDFGKNSWEDSLLHGVEFFVYYVLFHDGTSWGCQEDISSETIVKLSTKYKIERYSY